jgi:hypothetical protein
MPPSHRVAQLYSQASDSVFISFYEPQGYDGDIVTHLHKGILRIEKLKLSLCLIN